MLTKKTERAGFEGLALVSSTKNHNTSVKLHDTETKPWNMCGYLLCPTINMSTSCQACGVINRIKP